MTHPDVMGTQINKKFWNIDYYREVNFSHPGSTSQQTTAQANNTNPKNNAIIAQGTIKLKPGGVIKCYNQQSFEESGSPILGVKPVNASQIGYLDEKNEKLQYLVIINNGVSADLETVNLSLLVYYIWDINVSLESLKGKTSSVGLALELNPSKLLLYLSRSLT